MAVPQKQTDDFIRIQDLLALCLGKWPWFVVSLVITLGIATIYLLRTPPVYTRSASLLIKEDSKGQSLSSDVSSTFADMGLFQANTNVNNELLSLQSPAVMLDVVKRLHLEMDYLTDGHFHKTVLYGQTLPVSLTFCDLQDNENAGMILYLQAGKKLELDDFILNGEKLRNVPAVSGTLGDTLQTPVGKVLVDPSPYYREDYESSVYITRNTLHGATADYSSHLTVSLSDEKSTVINLSFQDVNTQRAEDVLNTLISVYNENWVKDKNQIAVSTSMFINERLGVIEGELGNVDEDISSYKSEHLLPDVQAAASMYMTQSSETNAQILALNTQLSMARYIRNYLTGSASKNQLLPVNSGIESSNIESQIAEYNTLQLQRNNLVSNSSEQNPLVMDLDQSLTALRSAIVTSIDNLMVTLNTQLRSLRQSEERTTARLAENPSQGKYLLSVERQQKVKEALYLFLLQKREENELSQAFTAYNTRVITPPSGSFLPTAPVKRNILLVAFALGILIPVVIIFLKENLNTKVRGRKDLENLSVPFVGEIPLYGRKPSLLKRLQARLGHKQTNALSGQIVVKEKNRNMINEAFRVVRTNLEFMAGSEGGTKVIMVTSFNPGSGKTFLTVNLAASLAIKGKKVIALDLDMRRASLSSYVSSPHTGLSNYLAGQPMELRQQIVHSENCPKLNILPVGTLPPNPTELLFAERLSTRIAQLKEDYDYVFIDCPPVEIVADAAIIGKQADMTLFITRAGLLERSMISEIDKLYEENKYKNLAIVLNGTETAYGKYGYHRYGYRYGYNYGYGNYASTK